MECELCFNPWNVENRIPKILSCGHTFCQSCLEDSLKKKSSEKEIFKCPSCKTEMNSILTYKDIINLRNNSDILSLIEKMEIQKLKTNTSNASLSLSFHINTLSNLNNEANNKMKHNEDNLIYNTKNNSNNFENHINDDNNKNYYPMCQTHKNKANFYIIKNENIIFICNDCLQLNDYENIFPLPSLKLQNEYKINSCKNKTKILMEEIDRVEKFLNSYQDEFEIENNKKIKELFDYIKNIIRYNITTAKTIFNQCKKEQKTQIDKKIQELCFLKKELILFDKKLDELLNLNQINTLPESQIELDNIYNKLGNYMNYENELNLFTMNISIKDEVKNSLFDIIQDSYKLDIDFLKMKNGELPTIKDLLNKSTKWACKCGNINNKIGKIICDSCSKYRPLETYTNIIFNPMLITKTEKKEYKIRRKHEWKVFQSLIKKKINNNNKKNNFLFAIDISWFNKWKSYISNDLNSKIMLNNEKYISENTNLGVLPPGPIDNNKICDNIENDGKLRLKKGLRIKKDYIVVNQLLWEWFLFNYDGGPEIIVENSNTYSHFLFNVEENKLNYLKKDESFEENLNNEIDNLYNIDYEINKTKNINKSDNKKEKVRNKIILKNFKDKIKIGDNESNISDSEEERKINNKNSKSNEK